LEENLIDQKEQIIDENDAEETSSNDQD